MSSSSYTSVFKRTDVPWEGFGLNIRVDDAATLTNQLQGLNAQWTRLYLETDDPGVDGIYFDNETFDAMWEQSENIQTQITRFAYSTFELTGSKFIFTARSAPKSWLTTDGTNELRGDALVAFARFFVSGVLVHQKFGMPVHWVEILDEPSTPNGTYINPDNYVILVQTFKSILATRTAPAVSDIKVMGPGLSCIVPIHQTVEPYIAAFKGIGTPDNPVIDAWSVHVLENEIDADYYNEGSFEARTYVKNQLTQTARFMKWTIPGLPLYVTKFGSNATRYSQGVDYGPGAPETMEYAMRLMDNVCGIVSGGASMAISWFLTFKHDNRALYRSDGSRRPQRDALALLNKILPTHGMMYLPGDVSTGSPDDQTLKTFVASRNSFGFILSRPHQSDALNGDITMQIQNPDWNSEKSVSTMNMYIFPSFASLGAVTKDVSVSNGIMTIKLQHLPFNCVVYGKGDVYATPTLLAPPVPKMSVTLPRVSDLASLKNVNEGDVIYNVQRKSLLIYKSGAWVPCQIYSGVSATLV